MIDPACKPEARDDALDLKAWIPFRMFRVAEVIANILADRYGPELGMKRAEWRTLAVVANYPEATVKDICDIGDMDPFTVSRAISQLTKLGYVVRSKNKADKRRALIVILPAGKQAVGYVSELARSLEVFVLKDLSRQDLHTLNQLLGNIEDAVAALRMRGWKNALAEEAE